MRLQKIVQVSIAVITGLYASAALADEASINAFVERTLVSGDATYGGCMALLSEDPAEVLPACRARWVTFSCDGTHTDPVRAYRMLDQAQLALATGMAVYVTVDDSKTHDGYCFASRIDLRSQ